MIAIAGVAFRWTHRFHALLNFANTKSILPIIASVSEHQPATWASYVMDLHVLVLLMPAGIWNCLARPTDSKLFLVTYAVAAVYFSGAVRAARHFHFVYQFIHCNTGSVRVHMSCLHAVPNVVRCAWMHDCPNRTISKSRVSFYSFPRSGFFAILIS